MANKLIKIVVDLENKASEQFKELNKQLKELKDNSDDAASSLNKIGKNQKQNTTNTKKNTDALNNNNKALKNNNNNQAILRTSLLGSVAALSAFVVAGSLLVKNAIDSNKELELLSLNAGINATQFKKLSAVYKAFGVSSEGVASAIKDIAERVNDAALNNAGEFLDIGKQLGLDAKSLNNLPIEELSERVISELVKIDNAATRTSFADRLGSDPLIQVVNLRKKLGPEFDAIQKRMNSLRLNINAEDSRKLELLNVEFQNLGDLLNTVNQEIVAKFSPYLTENVKKLTDWIQKLREGRSELFELLKGYAAFLGVKAEGFFDKFNVAVDQLNLGLQKVIGNQKDIDKAQKELDKSVYTDQLNELKQIVVTEETRLNALRASGKELNQQQKDLLQLAEASKQAVIDVARIEALQKSVGEKGKNTAIFAFSQEAVQAQLKKIDVKNIVISPDKISIDPNSLKVLDASKEASKIILGRTEIEIQKISLQEDKKQFGEEYSRLIGNLSKTVEDNKFKLNIYDETGNIDLRKSEEAVNNFQEKLKGLQEESKNGLSEKLFNDAKLFVNELKDSGISPGIVDSIEKEFLKKESDFKTISKGFTLKELELSIDEAQQKSDLFFNQYTLGIADISKFQNEYNKLLQITKERYGENSLEYQNLKNKQVEVDNMLFQKQIDNLDFLRETNKITIDEQIAGYEKLRSQVSKNSEMFKTLSATIEQLNIESFNQKVERTSLEIDLNKKSVDDLISVYEEQIKKVDQTSLEYLQLNAILKDLKDQKISEEFERINLEMQLGSKNINDLIKNYDKLIASTPDGSLENLSARVGKKQAEGQKQDETEALYESQIRSGNLTFQERNALLEEYQNYLISQRDLMEEGTQQYFDQEQKIKGLNEEFSTLFLTFEDLATMGTESLTDGLMNVLEGTGSVKDAFKSMAQSILQDLTQMILRAYIYQAIMASLGMAGAPTGGNIFNAGSLFSSVPMRHNGGSVSSVDDSKNSFRKINMLKPQSSLSSNERLIVARTDEYVVKKPNINSPTGNGSTSVQSPNISIQNIITDQMLADTMKNSDSVRDAIINIFQFNRDKF